MSLRAWIRQLFTRPAPRTARKALRGLRLYVEAMEDRLAPATVATGLATAVSASGATLNGTVNPQGATTNAYFQYSANSTFTPTVSATVGSGFILPLGVAVNAAGDVFVADLGHGAVKEVLPSGAILTLGSGFIQPIGVAVDAAGDVFVADTNNDAVKEVLPNGTIQSIGSGFASARGVAVDAAGDVFVADAVKNAVKEVLPSGAILTLGSGFSAPNGVAVDAAGDVFVADYGHSAVKEVLPSGAILTLGSGFSYPASVAVDAAGDVFVADAGHSAVKEVLPNGTIRSIGSGFSDPQGVAVDAAGDVFVGDSHNNRIVELSPPTVAATPSPLSGASATAVTGTLIGLSPGTTYYDRVVAASAGGTVAGATSSFTTQATPVASPNPIPLTYGTALANSQLSGTATALVNGVSVPVQGTFSFAPGSDVGQALAASTTPYQEAVTFLPNDTTDYTSAAATVLVNVGQATPTFSNLSVPAITYGPNVDTLSGTLSYAAPSGTLIPSGIVSITVDGLTQSASLLPATGEFAATFPTGLLAASASGYTVTFHYGGDSNFSSLSDNTSNALVVNKAPTTTTTVGAGPFTYTGTPQLGGSGTVAGANLSTSATSLTYSANADGSGTADETDAGTYYVTAHYAGDANHYGSDGSAVAITINKASSTTTTVGAGPFTYTGTAQIGGSGTVTGANLSTSAMSLTYSANADGSGTADETDAGTYYVTAHYAGDANHYGSDGSAVAITINKASSTTTTLGVGPFTYTGSAQLGGSGTVSGAGTITGTATLSYAANSDGSGTADEIDAGTYYVTAHYAGDANHYGSDGSAVAITINKASSTTTTMGAGPFTYSGSAQVGGSGTVSGADGLSTAATSVTYAANSDGSGTADQIDAGTYYVTAHYVGDANHLPSDGSPVAITINKASSMTTTVGDGAFIYDGTTHTGGTGSVTGAGGLSTMATSLSYTGDQIDAGIYYVTAHYAGDANHLPSDGSPVAITIDKASSTTTTLGAGPFTYDGTTHTGGSGTVAGADLNTSATSLTYTGDQIDAGIYYVTAHYAGDANHNPSDGSPVAITINKASSTTTTVGAGPFTYDGTTHTGGSGTVAGAGGLSTAATSLSYTGDQIDAGIYFVTTHYAGDANHNPSDGSPVAITINKASSTTTTVGAGPFTYDGTTHTGGSGTVAGAGGLSTAATSLSYSGDQIDAGIYYVTAHYAGDTNHNPSDGSPVAITINKASSTTVTAGAGPFTYDGTTHTGGSGTVSGADLNTSATSLTYTGDQIDAGIYYVTTHYAGDANHNPSDGSPVAISINKASSTTVTVGAGPFTYTGTAQIGGSGTVTGANLSISATSLTYSANADGSGTADETDAGTYYVTAHYAGDANHYGSDGSVVAIVINKASPSLSASAGAPVVLGTGIALTASATLAGSVNETGSITFTLYNPNNVSVYTDTVTVTGNGSYTTSMGTSTGSAVPTLPGTYQWVAAYGGDGNNKSISTTTGSTPESAVGAGASVVGSVLYLVGGNGNDQVNLKPIGTSSTGSTGIQLNAQLDGSNFNNVNYSQAFTTITVVSFNGNDNIQFANTLTIAAVISEGNGNDNIQLGAGNSTITLGNGNDNVQAGNGTIVLSAGNGNDNVQLGNGNNIITLGGGNDNVQLGSGNNRVTVGNGNDNIQAQAGSGNDTVTAGNGNDNVQLGGGNNIVAVGSGNDNIQAGDGANQVTAGAAGSTGNDNVQLGNGSDTVTLLGNGNDNVQAGTGAGDSVSIAGNGNDNVQLGNGAGATVTLSGNGNDNVQVGNGNKDSVSVNGNGNDNVQLGNGTLDDVSMVGNGNDNVQTGNGSGTAHVAGSGHKNVHLGSNGWTQS